MGSITPDLEASTIITEPAVPEKSYDKERLALLHVQCSSIGQPVEMTARFQNYQVYGQVKTDSKVQQAQFSMVLDEFGAYLAEVNPSKAQELVTILATVEAFAKFARDELEAFNNWKTGSKSE